MESDHDSAPSFRRPTLLSSSSLIGEDLLVEIFKRLPAKTLCRFLCVCKPWKSLISSTTFIKLHKSFTCSATPPDFKPYLRVYRSNSYLLYHPQQLSSNKVYFPFATEDDSGGENFTIVDVIHGVVCISYTSESRFDSTVLWNPAIHRFVTLPWIPFPVDLEDAKDEFLRCSHERIYMGECEHVNIDAFFDEVANGNYVHRFVEEAVTDCSVIGFGYDTSSDDFKVVRIWIPSGSIAPYCESLLPTYEVYSYRSGLWRVATADILKSCGLIEETATSKAGCFVNGSIHWIIHAGKHSRFAHSVLMFDCEGEVFRIVDFPVETLYKQKTELMEYAGMVSVVVYNPTDAELWVMEEHGVATSWKKLYRFRLTGSEFVLSDVYDDSFVNLAPYGPKQWTQLRRGYENEIWSGHVYEESLFLVDDAKAKSYTEEQGRLAVHYSFGEDLLLEMLKRLPAESLCRFRCVSKRWKSLISSDSFIKLHHSFACSATPPNLKPHLLLTESPNSCQDYSYALCSHRPLETNLVVEPLKLDDLHFPFRTQPDGVFNIVDVIHGVVCVSYSVDSSFDSTLLWNPAIHKYVALPRLPFPSHIDVYARSCHNTWDRDDGFLTAQIKNQVVQFRFEHNAIGFGYDASKNEFKVVRIWVPYKDGERLSFSPTYEVYSSRQWRMSTFDISINGFTAIGSRTGCFVNGTIHWLVQGHVSGHIQDQYTLLMFDCEREEFTTTILPCVNVGDMNGRSLHHHEAEPMEYEGMLSVVVSSCLVGPDNVVEHRVEVWVMEEHCVTASLKRRHQFAYVFDLTNPDLDNQRLFYMLTPRAVFHQIRVHGNHKKYGKLLSRHVYEESMFLMDDAEAQSYSKQGIVDICSEGVAALDYPYVRCILRVPFD